MSVRLPSCVRRLGTLLAVVLAGAAVPASAVPTFKTINVDGNLSDWDEILTNREQTSLDGDGSVVPCPFSTDRDCQVQSNGRDLRVFAWTYDAQYLYVYLSRQGSSSNDQTFWFYLDLDLDELMGSSDRVLRVRYNGSTGLTQNSLYPYVPVAPGGDAMVDGSNLADGYDMPGDCDSTPTWSESVPNGGNGDGDAFEERVPWSALGVPSGTGLNFHVGSSNSPNPSNISQQVDDNMGGLGGGLGSLGFDLVRVTPDNSGTVADGASAFYAHAITNAGTRPEAFAFKAQSSLGLSLTIWHDSDGDGTGDTVIGVDANGDGDFGDVGDVLDPAWNTGGDGYPRTPVLPIGGVLDVVLEVATVAGMSDQRDVSTLSAWLPSSPLDVIAAATDTTDIGALIVRADQAKTSVAGQNVSYPIVICNNGAPNTFDFVAVSTTASQVDLYSDPECDGVANDFLARDRRGDGSWDTIPDPPATDTDGDGVPDSGPLATGQCVCFMLQIRMSGAAPVGSQDVTTLTATGNAPASTADAALTTTIAARLEVFPDYTFAAQTAKVSGADEAVFFPHVARNNWLVADAVGFTTPPPSNTQGWTVRAWSDPDGDGNIADGTVITQTAPIPPNGGELHFIVEVLVPAGVPDGTRSTTVATATSLSSVTTFGTVTDENEVSSIATYSDPLFSIAETYFAPCATIYVEGTALGRQRDDIYDLVWRAPDGSTRRFFDPFFPDIFGAATDSLALGTPDAPGVWTIELRRDTLTIDTAQFIVEGTGVVESLLTDRPAYPLAGQSVTISASLRNGNVRATIPRSTVEYVVLDPTGTMYLVSGAPSTFAPYTGSEFTHSTTVPDLPVPNALPDLFTVPNVTFPAEGLYRVVATWRSECATILGQASVEFVAGIGEICDNGIDDDGDTLVDCADPTCALDPTCREIDCTDGIDGDGDTLVDCADPDCATDPACPEVDCANRADDDGDTLVDCDDPDCALSPDCHEENCDDGIDDDGDGLIDCADPDCATDPACPEDDCTNGIDDDGDTLADCLDADCAADPACFEVDCGDGIDNDSDGDIDCSDADCAGRPPCNAPEDCGNGLDDDGDTLIDCADPECAGVPGCDDSDGDTIPDGLDCAPLDPTAFAIPPEIARLDVAKPAPGSTDAVITWGDVRPVSGTGTVYDVVAGRIRQLWTDRDFRSATCLLQDGLLVSATDPAMTGAVSDGYWYLVEGENACGEGDYGANSLGTGRPVPPTTCD